MASNRYPVGDAVVVTCKINEHEWLATFPGFVATAMAESDALVKLAADIEGASKRVRGLAIELAHGYVNEATRFMVGSIVELTRDCELGHNGERGRVIRIDGPYMTVEFLDRSPVNTGRDYKFMREVK